MEGTVIIPDNDIDSFAARLGWTAFIEDPDNREKQIPNPISMEEAVLNGVQAYINGELINIQIIQDTDAARVQAIASKTMELASLKATITKTRQA